MTVTPSSFQDLLQFIERYFGRPLCPKERLKLQDFHNQVLFRKQSRLLVLRQREEILRQTQAMLIQLLERLHQEIQEIQKSLAESERELSASLPEASGDNGGLPISGNSGTEKQE
jgi:hypothetical protein